MEVQPVFNSYIAKLLIKMGNQIIDINKNKNSGDQIVFIFEKTSKLQSDLETITK